MGDSAPPPLRGTDLGFVRGKGLCFIDGVDDKPCKSPDVSCADKPLSLIRHWDSIFSDSSSTGLWKRPSYQRPFYMIIIIILF